MSIIYMYSRRHVHASVSVPFIDENEDECAVYICMYIYARNISSDGSRD